MKKNLKETCHILSTGPRATTKKTAWAVDKVRGWGKSFNIIFPMIFSAALRAYLKYIQNKKERKTKVETIILMKNWRNEGLGTSLYQCISTHLGSNNK